MADRPVLLITGPAGAGKSATADAWARSRPFPCAHVSLDDIREQVKSGFAYPPDGWNDETQRQYDLARGNVATMAR